MIIRLETTNVFKSNNIIKAMVVVVWHNKMNKYLLQLIEFLKRTEDLIKRFLNDMHSITQFLMEILACQQQSNFAKAYIEGLHKRKYW
jgi:hypothetical protein